MIPFETVASEGPVTPCITGTQFPVVLMGVCGMGICLSMLNLNPEIAATNECDNILNINRCTMSGK